MSDVDGDILSLIPASPSRGTLTRNSDGSYTYTLRRNYTSVNSFTYTMNDGSTSFNYVVVNNAQANNNRVIDWSGCAPEIGIQLQPRVLANYHEESNLAILTGLMIKL